jgi:hypothetical protein
VVFHGAHTPCGFSLSESRSTFASTAVVRVEELADCEEIHFYPERYWSYSDWFRMTDAVSGLLGARSLIVHGLSDDSRLAEAIAERYPQIRFTD